MLDGLGGRILFFLESGGDGGMEIRIVIRIVFFLIWSGRICSLHRCILSS